MQKPSRLWTLFTESEHLGCPSDSSSIFILYYQWGERVYNTASWHLWKRNQFPNPVTIWSSTTYYSCLFVVCFVNSAVMRSRVLLCRTHSRVPCVTLTSTGVDSGISRNTTIQRFTFGRTLSPVSSTCRCGDSTNQC